MAERLKEFEAATEKCKGLKYDAYRQAVGSQTVDRKNALQAIEALIDAEVPKKHGATGGRCEKPQSNGDHLRRGGCAADTDCCGAATGRPHGAAGPLVTVEVCQSKEASTWNYVAPRAPMMTTRPAPVEWPFVCIGGASKLAGAAAAVLASVYMMN